VTEVDDAGRKRASQFWLRGRLVGEAAWDKDGPAIAYGIRNGVKHGLLVEYHWGVLGYVEPHLRGLPHGWTRQFDRSGNLLIECPFTHGTGTDYWCDEFGNLSEEHPLVEGKPSGTERWWDGEDTIYEETSWLDGEWHGPRRRWREGSLEDGYPEFYVRGKRVTRQDYLRARRKDPTLLELEKADDRPQRVLPSDFIRLRAQAQKKLRRRRAR
jgi:hypothetical protein